MSRKYWAKVPCRTRKDARAIERALEEPDIQAFTVMMGVLLNLPSKRAAKRVLEFVEDHFDEQKGRSLHLETPL